MKNTNTNTKYGLIYKNHGKWSNLPSKLFTNLKSSATMKRIVTAASAQRKQPAKLVRLP